MSEPILTANELDALRDAVGHDSDLEGSPASPAGSRIVYDGEGLSRFRFGEGPVGGTQREERLSYVFDQSARMLERRFADVVQTSVEVSVTFLKVTRFAEFRDVFEVDVRDLAMLGFTIPGMPGQGLLVVEPEIVERIVAGLMGGTAAGVEQDLGIGGDNRSVTQLDVRVCRRVMGGFLDDVGIAWNPGEPLRPAVSSTDSTGVVARVYSDSTPVVAGLFELSVDQQLLGMIGLVLPRGVLDVLADPGEQKSPARKVQIPQGPFADQLLDFELIFEVALTKKRITARQLLSLAVGDVLHLGGPGRAVCTVQGEPRFVGIPGKQNGNKAVRITELLGRNDHAT